MTDQKTIDLIIRASLEGKADLNTVTKAIKGLESALDAQTQAAKKGESSIDELKATLLSLEQVQRNLTRNSSLVKEFDALPTKVDRASRSVEKAKTAYEKLAEEQKKSATVTEEQSQKLFDLSAKYENAQKRLDTLITRQGALRTELQALGADTNDLSTFQQRLVQTSADLGVVYAKTKQSIASYADDVRSAREAQRALAAEQAAAAKEAQQFEAAEKRATAAANARAAAAQEVADALSNRRSESAAAGNQFNNDAADAARARELAQLRADITQRSEEQLAVEKQLAKNSALAKTADDAQQAARQYTSLARASADLAPKIISVRSAVEDILNPTKAANSTLDGLETRISDLAGTIGKINGPVKDYRETLVQLNETQKSLATQANLVDVYQRQVAALRSARDEFTTARAKVAEYAAAVRQGGDSGQQFTASLTQAQAAAQRAAQALQAQLQSTRDAREALRTAGIATNDLTTAQARLVGSSQQAKQAADDLGKAVKEYGLESEKAGGKSGKGIFGDEGRTTLSLAQRIRGEILALTASYVGLQGAISLATSSLDSFNSRAATRTVIGVGLQSTDKAQIDAEYAYIKGQADRIGLVFADTAKQYSKFAAAAAFAGRPREEIKFIFESFSEAGRVLNLTQDNLNGVFLALEQIFSKGKISAEELRQQLGERLPAVFQVAQEALKGQFPDLNKAIEKGQVGAENLVLIAQKYREMVGSQLPGATQSFAASQARLTNAIEDFKLAIADAGFVDAYAQAIGEVTKFLQSSDGQKFAEGLAQSFQAVLNVVLLIVKNFDEFGAVLGTIAALGAVKLFTDMAQSLVTLGVAARGAAVALTGIQKAALVLSAFIVGWQIGRYLNEKFVEVQAFGVALVTGMDIVWTNIKYGAQIMFAELPKYAENAGIAIENTLLKMVRGVMRALANIASAVGSEDFAKLYNKIADGLIEKSYKTTTDKAVALRKEMEDEIAKIKKIQGEMFDDIIAGQKKLDSAKKPASSTGFPGLNAKSNKTGPTEAELAKSAREVEALEDRVLALEGRIERAASQTLDTQLQGVDKSTKDLRDDITTKVKDLQKRNELLARVDEANKALRLQTTEKFNKEIATAEESLQRQLEQAEAAAGRKSKASLDDRLNAVKQSYAKYFREVDDLIAKQQANGLDTTQTQASRDKMGGIVGELQGLEAKKFYEERINEVIKQRAQLVAAVRAQQQAGTIDQDTAAQRINEINAQSLPTITAIKDQAVAWAQANQQIFGTPELQQAFIANMQAISTEASNTKSEMTLLQESMKKGLIEGVGKGLDTVMQTFGEVAAGQMSLREGFNSLGTSVALFAAQFIRQIAMAILQAMVLKAIMATIPGLNVASAASSAGGVATAGTASIPANVAHTGGTVGSLQRSRSAPSAWFANAPKYHTGGIAGLAPSEYPAILQKNEEVLKASDPRNILNGGAAAGGGQPAEQAPVRFVLVDDRSKIPDAMNSADGERVILQTLVRNASTVRSVLGR